MSSNSCLAFMIYVTKLFDNKGLLLSCSILWRRKRRMLVIRWWHKIIASHFSNFSVSLVYYMFVIVHYLTYNRYSLHCLLYHISSLLTTHSNKLSHVYSLNHSPLLPHSPTFDVVWLSHIDIFSIVSHLFNINTPFFTVAVHPNKCCNQAHLSFVAVCWRVFRPCLPRGVEHLRSFWPSRAAQRAHLDTTGVLPHGLSVSGPEWGSHSLTRTFYRA